MAQRPEPTGSSRSRQRGKPVQVQIQQPRPWGLILGSLVLALGLVAILGFAITNQGAGFEDPLDKLDSTFDGLAVADESTLARNHVNGPVAYDQNPPNGGDHNGVPQVCRVYDAQVPSEHAVHSLEHGAVWITYKPDLPADQVTSLRELAEGQGYVLMSQYPNQAKPVNLSAWGRRLSMDTVDRAVVERFIEGYADGPQTPEKGATCAQGNSSTGTTPAGSAPIAPAPAASAAG
ncbi:MAG: hypothetical protein JWN57_1574 [Frankiales bacterium]|jgi:hypothetical protein|nr:hypothetical protein [Frankiales bacterium]